MSQTMLFKCPGPHDIHGGKFDYVIVDDAHIESKLSEGWFMTTPEAKAAKEEAEKPKSARDNAPPTRAELEQKAGELGIKFDGRTSDKKLSDLIDADLAG